MLIQCLFIIRLEFVVLMIIHLVQGFAPMHYLKVNKRLFSSVYVCHLEFLPPKARVKCTLIHLQYCFKYSAVSYWA
jgi:hypothetical protein